jgi:hypothetical protein
MMQDPGDRASVRGRGLRSASRGFTPRLLSRRGVAWYSARVVRVALAVIGLVGMAWADDGVPPRSKDALVAWLKARTYRATYVAEPAAHESAVHGGWLFYETLDATGRDAYFGRGLAVCAGCHRAGTDCLRSAFRP